MAHRPTTDFDELAVAFADYGTTLSGYVRYQLTRMNLKPYISGKTLNVLDVGGGGGGDTAWLAEQGQHVTYVEPSTEQRRFAERRFSFLLSDKARALVSVAGESLADLPPNTKKFDLVLAHTVAMYQPNPTEFLRQVMQYVKPGGLISIIEKGYYGTELRDIRGNNFPNLTRLHRTGRSINHMKQIVYAFKPEMLEKLLTDEHFSIKEWSGIRLLTDDIVIPVDTIDPKRLKAILAIEYEHGHNPSIRGQGQLLHFIARKA